MFFATVVASELTKSGSPNWISSQLRGFLGDDEIKNLYQMGDDFLKNNQFDNFELRSYGCYKFFYDLLGKDYDETFPEELLNQYRIERSAYYIVSAIIERFKGTNDIVVISVADPFLDAIEELPKFYRDMASTINIGSDWTFEDLKKLDQIFTAVKVERRGTLKECAMRAIEGSDGMIFDGDGDADQLYRKNIQDIFRAFIKTLYEKNLLSSNSKN